MQAAVKRDENKVWIEGVKGFSPAEYADSVHGSQARILQALGEPLTYDDLIGYSGFAFRVNVHEAMCPSGGHPCCGYMCLDNAFRALPWETKLYESFPWGPPKADRAAFEAETRAAVRASINRGIPVHYGGEEDGLIIGYGDEGRRWWCVHPYHQWGAEPFWHDEGKGMAGGQWPWAVSVWVAPKPTANRTPAPELLRAALAQAVEMWQTEKRQGYFCGDAAYGHWLGWLRDVEAGQVAQPAGNMQGNGWYFDVLVHSRRIASRWLRQQAATLEGDAQGELLAAADRYARLVEICMQELGCTWDLALPPNKAAEWTSDKRRELVRRLEQAREHDRAAIGALARALALPALARPRQAPG